MALVTLHTRFPDAFAAYAQPPPLPAHVRKAARAIMPCRTAARGGPVQACPDGPRLRLWHNSGRHRAWPQGAYLQIERWVALPQVRLLTCDHDHVLCTLPHALKPLWLVNVPVMPSLLLQAGRETECPLLAEPQYLGAPPGLLAVRHTWSQPLGRPPHVHGLVTGGAWRSFGGRWWTRSGSPGRVGRWAGPSRYGRSSGGTCGTAEAPRGSRSGSMPIKSTLDSSRTPTVASEGRAP
jgi:hypothetical protein